MKWNFIQSTASPHKHHFTSSTLSAWNLVVYIHMSSLSQIKGAEESQFILRCDVRFEQQCSTQALQDLGGEKTPECNTHGDIKCRVTVHQTITLVMTHATICLVLSIAENPQQDKKNLLCLWEVDGKLQRVLSFQYIRLISQKLSRAIMVLCWFSAPLRIPHATTGPTDWLWPNSVLLTSPSCLCCSKVTDTRSVACKALAVNAMKMNSQITDMLLRYCLCPDMTFINEGNPNYVDKLVNFEKLVRLKRCFATLLGMITLLKNLVLRVGLTQVFSFPPIRAAHDG